jgi:hypothetical protein
MKITIEIRTGNAAFEDESEIYNILVDQVAAKIGQDYERDGNLRDSNGNAVGKFKVTGK